MNKELQLNTIRANVDAFLHYFKERSGKASKSLHVPYKLIYFYLRMFADSVQHQYSKDKTNKTDLDFTLVLDCVEMMSVDTVNCPCAPASGCKWMMSKEPLPKMIEGKPTSVTLLKLSDKVINSGVFEYVKWEDMAHKVNSRHKGIREGLYYTMQTTSSTKNQHLFIYGNSSFRAKLKRVRVEAQWRDHLEFCCFPVCGDKKNAEVCSPLDEEFVINKNIKDRVFALTYDMLTGMKRGTLADVLNNENDDTATPVTNT